MQLGQHGLHSVWIHDSLYERDAVTYASAIAAQVPDIRVAMGALSTYTRAPALISMTVSALDEMAPGALFSAWARLCPCGWRKWAYPTSQMRGWKASAKPSTCCAPCGPGSASPLPLPTCRRSNPCIPRCTAYRFTSLPTGHPFLQLAGRKADGYLARPAESIPNLQRLIRKLQKASLEEGRDQHAVDIAGYLLTHVDKSRRAALNRAKREPFVIYMMSVLSNFSLQQAGFEPELRDRIMTAWRAEDYHAAAELIPDDMLDAFMLCGTPEEVAEGAARFNAAGMDTPIIQPVVQEDNQIQLALQAAALYGSLAVRRKGGIR